MSGTRWRVKILFGTLLSNHIEIIRRILLKIRLRAIDQMIYYTHSYPDLTVSMIWQYEYPAKKAFIKYVLHTSRIKLY
jgi:hypothetical protein